MILSARAFPNVLALNLWSQQSRRQLGQDGPHFFKHFHLGMLQSYVSHQRERASAVSH
jgi:hypothetical protein